MKFIYSDGGRMKAGFKGQTRDCVTRAIAIATGKPYKEVYNALHKLAKDMKVSGNPSPRTGVQRKVYDRYLKSIGWVWCPTMGIGTGCQVHLTDGELPPGRLIVRLSKHLTVVADGIIYDNHNPQRSTVHYHESGIKVAHRCVYGYYKEQQS